MKKSEEKAVVIFSGGQDSTTCLYWALKKFGQNNVEAITFNYGQNHSVELNQSKKICQLTRVKQTIIDCSFFQTIVDSALTSNGDVNTLNSKQLPSSFVPNRNQLFITLSHAYAQKINANHLVTGVCQTDYSGYPDCRAEFIELIQLATNNGSSSDIHIHTPLMYLSKSQVFYLSQQLSAIEVIIEHSHTCYNGDRATKHAWGYGCRKCEACKLRENGWEQFSLLYS